MPRRSSVVLLAAFIVATLVATTAAAQHRGTVVDEAGRPVPGATVELWTGTRSAAATETASDGTFHLPRQEGEGPLTLSIRRMGLRTEAIRLSAADTALLVRMQALPVALAPVVVSSARRRMCPNREDPRARALWERMRARYWQARPDSIPYLGLMEMRSGIAEKGEIGDPSVGFVRPAWASGVAAHRPGARTVSGYAWRANGGTGERTAFWFYYGLDGGSFQDFTRDYFGSVHSFSVAGSGEEGTIVAFCPRERLAEHGQIEGTLVLAPDTTLAAARWTFRTRRPVEDAGGEARYFPPDAALGNLLLARETLFWRGTTGDRYYFEARRFSLWRVREPGERYHGRPSS